MPPSYLADLRVLALVSNPVEPSAGQSATIKPHVYLPEGQDIASESWDFCPFSPGAALGYACAVPACLTPLSPAADGTVTLEPLAQALRCAATFADPSAIPAGFNGGSLPELVETVVRYTVTSSAGQTRVAALRLAVRAKPSAVTNRNPVISRVEIGGTTVAPGGKANAAREGSRVTVRTVVDPASLDTFVDSAGRQRNEAAVVSLYSSAGRFEYDRENGVDVTSTLKLEDLAAGQKRAEVYVVVRDLRGGQAVAGPFVVPVIPATSTSNSE